MTPTAMLAEKRWKGRDVAFQFYDEMVLSIEAEYGFQAHPETGKSQADPQLIEAWNRAWRYLARAGIQSRNVQRITERNAFSKLALEQMTANLVARQARTDALVELVASTPNTTLRTEPQPIDLVSPLGERGPPCVRAISSDRGHDHASTRNVLTGCRKSTIVPTGRSGGDG
jgi:hypothetical protein